MKKKHTKHTSLIKPDGGDYHRNEWAIIGAPCGVIKTLATGINKALSNLKVGFLDADHKKARAKSAFYTSYTDKISYQAIATKSEAQIKQNRKFYNDLDLLLINGNHFIGTRQIVIINEEKKESLSRKLDRLTDIKMILLEKSSDDIHEYLLELIKDKKDIQMFRVDQVDKISNALLKELIENQPALFGLVLSGGKSQRMGEDKGALDYHGKPQREYEADLVNKFCNRTFISCRQNQDELIETNYEKLYDTFTGLGPYGGILSAFRSYPNAAWLTIACDMPYVSKETIKQLVKNRNPQKLATCFHNTETEFPEPLMTIWEPRAYPVLLEFLSQGYSCPRKVLINTDIEELTIEDQLSIANANDPNEMEEAKAFLSKQD